MKKDIVLAQKILYLTGNDVQVVDFPLVDILRCADVNLALVFRGKVKCLSQDIRHANRNAGEREMKGGHTCRLPE